MLALHHSERWTSSGEKPARAQIIPLAQEGPDLDSTQPGVCPSTIRGSPGTLAEGPGSIFFVLFRGNDLFLQFSL